MNRLPSTTLLLLSLTAMGACTGGGHGGNGDGGDGGQAMPCVPPQCQDMAPSAQCPQAPPIRNPTYCKALNAPICADQSCRACRTSTECGAGSLCWALPSDGMGHYQGQCVDATSYVDLASASCVSVKGTQTNPFCQIQNAIDAASSPAVIQVTPSPANKVYGGLTISSQQVVIFTPMDARDAQTPTRIAGVTVSGTGYAVLSDVVVQGGGVSCASAMGRLGLNRTAVLSSSGNGVVADPCGSLAIDSSLIALSGQLGLRIGAVKDYQVTNSVIVQNNQASVTTLYGVYLGQASADKSPLMFAFNTVVMNGVANNQTDVGGVFCAGSPIIHNSIIANNQGTQIGSGCAQSGKVVTATPDFVGGVGSGALTAQRYRLIVGDGVDNTCCIDKATGTTIDHDYYQTVRPVPPATAPTIGFAEQ